MAEQRRLNGFQAKCVRQILGIKPAYWSRVSNVQVLRQAGMKSATELLTQQQLMQFGKVLRAPQESALRHTSLIPGTLQPSTFQYVRRVGRARKEWTTTVLAAAYRRKLGGERLEELAQDCGTWKMFVKR